MVIIIFIYGLVIGSFLNVCIYRIPRKESITYPPSHCTNCGNRIRFYDLIPVISYIVLRGKCRYCESKISIIYPVIELSNALLYLAVYMKYGFGIEFIRFAVFSSLMILIGMIDFKTTDVYFSVVLIGLIIGGILFAYDIFNHMSVSEYVYGALLGGGIIALIIIITGGMGWGDAEICFLCGLFCGFKLTILTLFLSFIIGGIEGIFLIAAKKKKKTDYIPFGPSIAAASIISIIIGDRVILWYISKFFV